MQYQSYAYSHAANAWLFVRSQQKRDSAPSLHIRVASGTFPFGENSSGNNRRLLDAAAAAPPDPGKNIGNPQLSRRLERHHLEPGCSPVGRVFDCRLVQPSDGPWLDSGWPDFTCLDPERPIQLRQGCNINHMLCKPPRTPQAGERGWKRRECRGLQTSVRSVRPHRFRM